MYFQFHIITHYNSVLHLKMLKNTSALKMNAPFVSYYVEKAYIGSCYHKEINKPEKCLNKLQN